MSEVEGVLATAIDSKLCALLMPQEAWLEIAKAQIEALEAAGYVIVPVEATEEMCWAGNGGPTHCGLVWRAMVGARPR